jgi:hypothetical protein
VTRIGLIALFLLAAVAAIIIFNANVGAGEAAIAIWAIASVLLGWGTGQLTFALLAFLAVPLAIPFGYPDNYEFSEPMPIWWGVGVCAIFSAGLVFLSALLKLVVEAHRHRKPRRSGAFSTSG